MKRLYLVDWCFYLSPPPLLSKITKSALWSIIRGALLKFLYCHLLPSVWKCYTHTTPIHIIFTFDRMCDPSSTKYFYNCTLEVQIFHMNIHTSTLLYTNPNPCHPLEPPKMHRLNEIPNIWSSFPHLSLSIFDNLIPTVKLCSKKKEF